MNPIQSNSSQYYQTFDPFRPEEELLFACQARNWNQVNFLIAQGVKPSQKALYIALKQEHLPTIKLFLERGAQVDFSYLEDVLKQGLNIRFLAKTFNCSKKTLNFFLQYAINFKNSSDILTLLQEGADPNAYEGEIIREAAENGDSSSLRFLYLFGGIPLGSNSTSITVAKNSGFIEILAVNDFYSAKYYEKYERIRRARFTSVKIPRDLLD